MLKSFENKLSFLFIFILFGIIAIGFITRQRNEGVAKNAELVAHTQQVLIETEKILSLAKEFENGSRSYAITGDESYLIYFGAAQNEIASRVHNLKELTKDNANQQPRIDSLENLIESRLDFSHQTIHVRNVKGAEAAKNLIMTGTGQLFSDQIRKLVNAIEDEEKFLLNKRTRAYEESENAFNSSFYLLLLSAIGLLVAAYFLIRNQLELRKEAEEELSLKTEWYSQTLLCLGDGVIATDKNGIITLLNKAATELTGWSEQEAIGKSIEHIFPIVHEETGNKVVNPLIEAIRNNKVSFLANHTVLTRKDGTELFIDDSGAPVHDANGNITGGVLVFRDISEKKKAENALVHSIKKFNKLFNFSPVAKVIVSAKTNCMLDANDAFCRMVGYEKEKMIGKTSRELNLINRTAEEQEQLYEELAKSGGRLRDKEVTMKKPNGETIQALFSTELMEIDDEKCYVYAFVDITIRKKALHELRIQKEWLSQTLECLGDGVIATDPNGTITLMNKAAVELTGWTEREAIGKHVEKVFSIVNEESGAKVANPVIEAIRKNKVSFLSNHTILTRKDGTKLFIDDSGAPVRDADGNIKGGVLVFRDISEKKKSEEQLKEYQHFFNNNSDLCGIAKTDGYFTLINDKFEKVLGYSNDEFLAYPFFHFTHPDDLAATQNEVEKLKQGVSTINFLNRYLRKDGTYVWLEWTSTPDVGTGKLYAIARNITERKEFEMSLQQANKALEAFSYSVSHDLKAPVRTVIGFTNIIRKEYGDSFSPDLEELFSHIESSTKRMKAIIDDLLTLAKYGKEKLKPCTVNMNDLVKKVWDEISLSMSHRATLEMQPLPEVEGDISMLEQVIVNLLSNAIKYSSKKEAPLVQVSFENNDGTVTYLVKDNGAGFDMRHYNRMFGAFQRLHGMSEFEGTGVGLLLVKQIIERHAGAVWAEGKPGEGATFYFSLPAKL